MKQKNKLKLLVSTLLILVLSFSLSSCFGGKEEKDGKKTNSGVVEKNTKKEYYKKIDKFLVDGKYKEAIDSLEGKGVESLNEKEKKALIVSYLRYGNSFYKEKENSQKAIELLNQMEENPEVLYYKGYANEIIENYSGALEHYNKGLEIKNIDDNWKSTLLNQIGHVYDLQGDSLNAFQNYEKAKDADKENIGPYLMLGRYYIKTGVFQKAIETLEKVENKIENKFVKAELYFNLSTLYLYKQSENPVKEENENYQKSIDYAQKAIDINPNYPNGYIGVARILIYLGGNLKDAEDLLNNAIELYPKTSIAYKFLGLMKLSLGENEKAIDYLKIAEKNLKDDITLFADEKAKQGGEIYYYLAKSNMALGNKKKATYYVEKFVKSGNLILFYTFFEEIRKEDYGKFNSLKGYEEFENLIKDLKKLFNY